MRAFTVIGNCLLMLASATALDNNKPETWLSPNREYAIKEAFYGEGKLVRGIFVHVPTSLRNDLPGQHSGPVFAVESR